MPASHADLAIYQGDDYAATVTVLNDDGTPADITGFTARAQIRRGVADSDPVVTLEITTAVESPLVHLAIGHDDTETLNGRYRWDLQLTSPDDQVITILAGNVVVTAEVTREPVPLTATLAKVA